MASTIALRSLTMGALALVCGFTWTAQPATAHAQVVIEIEALPPPRIETYPRTWYHDREVYWAHGRWYYRKGPRWYYYRHEPPPLRHHRVTVFERHPRQRVHEVYREPRHVHRHKHHKHKHSRHRRVHDERSRVLVIR